MMGYIPVQRRTDWAMIVQIPALVSPFISCVPAFCAQKFLPVLRLTQFSPPIDEKITPQLCQSIVNQQDWYFVLDEILSSMKGQTD